MTPATRPWLTRMAWLSVGLAIVACFGMWPLSGGDLYMHLLVGRVTYAHGWPPMTDVFSYTSAGQEFLAHSWLAELAFYLIEQSTGTLGFMALGFALATARLLNASWPAIILLAPVVLCVVWGRLEFRPQLATSMALSAELYLLLGVHLGERSPCWLWLPPLFALWINLHGGWAIGLAMLVVCLLAVVAIGSSEPCRSVVLYSLMRSC